MTAEVATLLVPTHHQIKIQARSGGMRVTAIWQVLMPVAGDIERVQVAASRKHDFEDMTISFAKATTGSLGTVLARLKQMPWVSTAELS
ncbi:hypothetical protein VOM14_27565 [Paraburkholderia sp. MPAMCS5]|uniref:hypothetical protein n=1 Tax=Paraburkholderia sp. MPAMCS5 TaxID=3112563 RepID=UPI002E19DB1F|nr:hypothetical protein [Paraburkholderia sp. MPAMCS5]